MMKEFHYRLYDGERYIESKISQDQMVTPDEIRHSLLNKFPNARCIESSPGKFITPPTASPEDTQEVLEAKWDACLRFYADKSPKRKKRAKRDIPLRKGFLQDKLPWLHLTLVVAKWHFPFMILAVIAFFSFGAMLALLIPACAIQVILWMGCISRVYECVQDAAARSVWEKVGKPEIEL